MDFELGVVVEKVAVNKLTAEELRSKLSNPVHSKR